MKSFALFPDHHSCGCQGRRDSYFEWRKDGLKNLWHPKGLYFGKHSKEDQAKVCSTIMRGKMHLVHIFFPNEHTNLNIIILWFSDLYQRWARNADFRKTGMEKRLIFCEIALRGGKKISWRKGIQICQSLPEKNMHIFMLIF